MPHDRTIEKLFMKKAVAVKQQWQFSDYLIYTHYLHCSFPDNSCRVEGRLGNITMVAHGYEHLQKPISIFCLSEILEMNHSCCHTNISFILYTNLSNYKLITWVRLDMQEWFGKCNILDKHYATPSELVASKHTLCCLLAMTLARILPTVCYAHELRQTCSATSH